MARPALLRAVDAAAGSLAGVGFAALSFARRRRIFHPDGVAFHARLAVVPPRPFGAALLDERRDRRCLVRLSQGAGLPDGVPDILGVAVRVLDDDASMAAQDLLFATVLGDGHVARHVLAPASSFADRPFSTVLPYRTGSGLVVLTLRPVVTGETSGVAALEDAARAFGAGDLTFSLVVHAAGASATVGGLRGGNRLPGADAEALRFNPFHASLGLVPAGGLNVVRRRAYAGSQAGRPTPGTDPTDAPVEEPA